MIKLSENIYWDETSSLQSEEVTSWLGENVLSKLGVNDEDKDLIAPELDRYKRPYKWQYNGDGYTIIIEREYIAPAKWAKKCDTIKVIEND